ncbi:hypothetical protein GE09DRAFT_642968 [Coniochaeta sp. 2T2.1]|nr:hypothetical protein GE09DRAFT_642968 [Coniochaeta sp. 2T2.1]
MANPEEEDDPPTPEARDEAASREPHTLEVSDAKTLEALERGDYTESGIKNLYIRYSVHLASFTPAILQLCGLELLDISGCGISSLPPNLGRTLPGLNILYLTDCGFTTFPDLSSFPDLVCASLGGNSITTIPEGSLPASLLHLILTNNDLDRLPDSIGNCKDLKTCRLSGNRLSSLPWTMERCRNLELVRISCNAFESLPTWLVQLPKLSQLTFAGNPCSSYGEISYPPCPPDTDWVYLDDPRRRISNKNVVISGRVLGKTTTTISHRAAFLRPGNRRYSRVVFRAFVNECTDAGTPEDELAAHLLAGRHRNLVNPIAWYRADLEAWPPAGAAGDDDGEVGDEDFHGGLVMQRITPGYRVLTGGRKVQPYPSERYSTTPLKICDLSVEGCVKILLSVADAAFHLHNRGIMHGELAGFNVYHHQEREHTLLVGMGAATIYTYESMEDLRPYVERIEVLAFGKVVEHVMKLFNPWSRWDRVMDPPANLDNEGLAMWRYERHVCDELRRLRDECLDGDVIHRPGFWEVQRDLEVLVRGYRWLRDFYRYPLEWVAGQVGRAGGDGRRGPDQGGNERESGQEESAEEADEDIEGEEDGDGDNYEDGGESEGETQEEDAVPAEGEGQDEPRVQDTIYCYY